jgi:hypothetical protein
MDVSSFKCALQKKLLWNVHNLEAHQWHGQNSKNLWHMLAA